MPTCALSKLSAVHKENEFSRLNRLLGPHLLGEWGCVWGGGGGGVSDQEVRYGAGRCVLVSPIY